MESLDTEDKPSAKACVIWGCDASVITAWEVQFLMKNHLLKIWGKWRIQKCVQCLKIAIPIQLTCYSTRKLKNNKTSLCYGKLLPSEYTRAGQLVSSALEYKRSKAFAKYGKQSINETLWSAQGLADIAMWSLFRQSSIRHLLSSSVSPPASS